MAANARVEKTWKEKGLSAYSVEQILGTLAHYGVTTSESDFVKLAKTDAPLGIAAHWDHHWKGTGQFALFPIAAAEELWSRWLPGALRPRDVAEPLVKLVQALWPVEKAGAVDVARFDAVEQLLARFPQGELRDAFSADLSMMLGDWLEDFDATAHALVEAKLPDLALRFAKLEEALFPVREGCATALVRGLTGDAAGAIEAMEKQGLDSRRHVFSRLSAYDVLFQLKAVEEAKLVMATLVTEAEMKNDRHLLEELVVRFDRILEGLPPSKEATELLQRFERLAERLS